MILRTSLALLFLAAPIGAQEVDIKTVTVANPGNPDDSHGEGYGGVAYVYGIGQYEVTAGQYTRFLNAVAATDTHDLYDTKMLVLEHGCKIAHHGSAGVSPA